MEVPEYKYGVSFTAFELGYLTGIVMRNKPMSEYDAKQIESIIRILKEARLTINKKSWWKRFI